MRMSVAALTAAVLLTSSAWAQPDSSAFLGRFLLEGQRSDQQGVRVELTVSQDDAGALAVTRRTDGDPATWTAQWVTSFEQRMYVSYRVSSSASGGLSGAVSGSGGASRSGDLFVGIYRLSASGDALHETLVRVSGGGWAWLKASGARAPTDGPGTVVLRVRDLVYRDGALARVPAGRLGVFLDGNVPYGGPPADDFTDEGGVLEVTLSAGPHRVMFSRMTSSHSLFASPAFPLAVTAGARSEVVCDVCTADTTILARFDPGLGQALYVSGATDLLGRWETAYKMTPGPDGWSFHGGLPRGLPFKILLADWVEGDSIPASQARWERGDDHFVESTAYMPNAVVPVFD